MKISSVKTQKSLLRIEPS